jgi:hypothetical protein
VLGTAFSDYAACLVDLFLALRPGILGLAAVRAYETRSQLTGVSTWPVGGFGNITSPLQGSLLTSWRVWAGMASMECLAAIVSYGLKRFQVPLVTASRDYGGATTMGSSSSGIRGPISPTGSPLEEDGGTTRPTQHPASPTSSNNMTPPTTATTTVESARLQVCIDALMFSCLRDPFFAVVLREWVHGYLVAGWVNRWVPFLGWLLSAQITYYMTLQHNSFLYTVGPS